MLRIRLADKNDIPAIASVCKDNVLGTKILCQINAYGTERNFLDVWCCIDESGRVSAVISKFEDSITIADNMSEDYEDYEDLKTFLDMLGFKTLCCTFSTAQKLSYLHAVNKKAYKFKGTYNGEIISELEEKYYKSCYSLICSNIPDSFSDTTEAYYSFLSDFTFRKRRGLARIKGFTDEEKVYSCALTSAETDDSAIISGVACDITARKTGLGKKTVLTLANELQSENKKVFVIALNESAEGFYEHIGFVFHDKISFIERIL